MDAVRAVSVLRQLSYVTGRCADSWTLARLAGVITLVPRNRLNSGEFGVIERSAVRENAPGVEGSLRI